MNSCPTLFYKRDAILTHLKRGPEADLRPGDRRCCSETYLGEFDGIELLNPFVPDRNAVADPALGTLVRELLFSRQSYTSKVATTFECALAFYRVRSNNRLSIGFSKADFKMGINQMKLTSHTLVAILLLGSTLGGVAQAQKLRTLGPYGAPDSPR